MQYKYETHLHTKEASACSFNTGAELVRAAKEAGYAGIMVTDHHWGGNTAISRDLPWEDFVEQFCKGYENAKEEGDKIGLDVFFGWESGYQGTEFLIYGLDKAWMLQHPELKEISIEEQYELVSKSGGMVIHAHPYREEWYIPEIRIYPEHVDAVEAINAAHSNPLSGAHFNPEYNRLAIEEYAKKYNLPVTAGSDVHSTVFIGGGIYFDEPLKDIQDYMTRVKNRNWTAITDGVDNWNTDLEKI